MNQTQKIIFEETSKSLTQSDGTGIIMIATIIVIVSIAFWLSFKKDKPKEIGI